MNIHHKNMKQIAIDTEAWNKKNFSHLDIYECAFSRHNIKDASFMALPSEYAWYNECIANSYDSFTVERIQNSLTTWSDKGNKIQTHYHKHFSKGGTKKKRIDIVQKTSIGFDMLAIGCSRELSMVDINFIQNKFHQLAHIANKVERSKPRVLLELNDFKRLKALHAEEDHTTHDLDTYEKSNFDYLTLTAKELKYIEYALLNHTQKEIASQQQCSQTAVRKVFSNIKRKTKCESMPMSTLMHKLKALGVLKVLL